MDPGLGSGGTQGTSDCSFEMFYVRSSTKDVCVTNPKFEANKFFEGQGASPSPTSFRSQGLLPSSDLESGSQGLLLKSIFLTCNCTNEQYARIKRLLSRWWY